MRPKGWRLDPAWVEHYSKREGETWAHKINEEHSSFLRRLMEAREIRLRELREKQGLREMDDHERIKAFWRDYSCGDIG
jgi:hypothetical protein